MPDLVNDPKYFGVNQPSMDNPLHDDDPSNDYMFDEWKAGADLWREWAAKQDDAIADYLKKNTSESVDADQALRNAGFVNAKEQGKHAFTMYGKGGYFGEQGAAADPGWEYNWATGKKRNIGTADKTARDRWVPINAEEYGERKKAQTYSQQGLTDYGRQSAAEAFKVAVRGGHFNYDPTTGTWYSGTSANDPAGHTARGWGMTPGNMGVNLNGGTRGNTGFAGGPETQSTRGVGPNEYRPYLKVPANNASSAWGRPNAQATTKPPVSEPVKLAPTNPASTSFPTMPGLKSTAGEEEKKKSSLTGTTDYGTLTGSSYGS